MASAANPESSFYRRELPKGLVPFSSEEGKARFNAALAAGTAHAFFPLVSQYQTQSHPALCGLTTLTIMLNSLEIDPGRVWMDPWRWFAESLLDCCLDLDTARTKGVTMEQLAQTARCNGADVAVLRRTTPSAARALFLRCVRAQPRGREEFAAVSFSRRSLAQTGDGHFSPIAAFDAASDSVLILDTARFKYGPYWVDVKRLVAATEPVDEVSGLPRGFLTFKRSAAGASAVARPERCTVACRMCPAAPTRAH